MKLKFIAVLVSQEQGREILGALPVGILWFQNDLTHEQLRVDGVQTMARACGWALTRKLVEAGYTDPSAMLDRAKLDAR